MFHGHLLCELDPPSPLFDAFPHSLVHEFPQWRADRRQHRISGSGGGMKASVFFAGM
jgi:hypothetical protein